MFDLGALFKDLDDAGFKGWASGLEALIAERFADSAHGNLREWRNALGRLPPVRRQPPELCADAVGAPALLLDDDQRGEVRNALLDLRPWRKGPFSIDGVLIDAEWRSNLKWDRIAVAMSPLDGRVVLDVGCGNGYYALRMRGAGARLVIGVDPTLVYVVQFQAISHFLEPQPVHVLPLRLDDLPARAAAFDTVFSMGVLYHQRAPIEHLRQLRDALRPGGELILETIVLPGDEPISRTPENRYARMRNVWHLPTIPELVVWLGRVGLIDVAVADTTATTTDEQRSTEWMPFESLADALDPDDSSRTVEGWPAPLRAVIVCRRAG